MNPELQQLQRDRKEFLSNSPLLSQLQRGDVEKSENRKLERIETSIAEMNDEITKVEIEAKMLAMKAELMTKRVEELEAQKRKQLKSMQELSVFLAKERYYHEEIQRKERMYDEVISSLEEVRATAVFANQPPAKDDEKRESLEQ